MGKSTADTAEEGSLTGIATKIEKQEESEGNFSLSFLFCEDGAFSKVVKVKSPPEFEDQPTGPSPGSFTIKAGE